MNLKTNYMDKPEHYTTIKTGRSSLHDWLNKNYPEFYTYLIDVYKGIDIKTALYMYYNGIKDIPLCECGKPVKFHGYTYGFSKFCCPSCAGKNEDVQLKLKQKLIDTYGENYLERIIDKGKETKIAKCNKHGCGTAAVSAVRLSVCTKGL